MEINSEIQNKQACFYSFETTGFPDATKCPFCVCLNVLLDEDY